MQAAQKRRRNRQTQTEPRRKVGALHCHRRRLPNGPIQARFRVALVCAPVAGRHEVGHREVMRSPRSGSIVISNRPCVTGPSQPDQEHHLIGWWERGGNADARRDIRRRWSRLCRGAMRGCIVRSMLRPQHEGLVIAIMSAWHKHLIAASRTRRFTRHRRRTPGGRSAEGSTEQDTGNAP